MDRTTRNLGVVSIGVVLATVAFVWVPGGGKQRPARMEVALQAPPGASTVARVPVHVVDHLPQGYRTDGSVDYTAAVQRAIDAASGATLVLPAFPLLVSAAPGQRWCLRITTPIAIEGQASSVLVERQGAVQVLRSEGVDGVRLCGFTVQGIGRGGRGLAHGLVQVTYGRNVSIEGVRVLGSDADGIAVAGVQNVRVAGCTVEGASKSGIYLSDCERGIVAGNVVTGSGGHLTPAGDVVGAGIQISSNAEVVCADNLVAGGTGIGILCNALAGGAKPMGCVIAGNRIRGVANPANMNVSSGIRLANGNPDRLTHTLVAGNSIQGCGVYGMYVENHGGSTVSGNTVVESERAGIVVSTIRDLALLGNTVLNSGVSGLGSSSGIQLVNGARDVVARDNVVRNAALFRTGHAEERIDDGSNGGGHDLEPRVAHAPAPPIEGTWRRGDLVWNTAPRSGQPSGWICVQDGAPGAWAAFGRIE
jgi:parallel beta-helix repeat protein